MTELVSILIPAYNAEKWLRGCLESAVSQSWARKETIVVDDGSTDRTLEIARSYASRDVKVLTQENRGASAARNCALSLAQGDYIQWLDADDLLAPGKIEHQMREAQPGGSFRNLLSCPWGRFYSRPEAAKFSPGPLWRDLDPKEWLYLKLRENAWMAVESWLVSRKLAELAGPWDEQLTLDDDGEYFCRVLSNSDAIRFVPEAAVLCRRGIPGSLSYSPGLSEAKLDSQFQSICQHIRTLHRMENSQRTREACLLFLQRWLIHFYPERPEIVEKMQQLAAEIGGTLHAPVLDWKYSWMKHAFGWSFAKSAQHKARFAKNLVREAIRIW